MIDQTNLNCITVHNDDHIFYIKRLYPENTHNNMFLLLMVDAYESPVSEIVTDIQITKTVFSYKLNRFLTLNDLY